MSCFGGNVSPDLFQQCCNAHQLCEWNGNLNNVVSEPIYVQKVYDAVLFNLQGLKTVSNQCFSPAIPKGSRLKRVVDIRCKRFFNPQNVDDPDNLSVDLDTTISGATFLQKSNGELISVVGPDGTFSERVLFADTDDCDDKCMGTPIFGTQNIHITGDVLVSIDLLLLDRNDREFIFTVTTNVNIAKPNNPLMLTNFFELCMPSTRNSAFLPRFTEFCNPACETRLATNNMGRDITVCPDGTIKANLIIAICLTCEKKIVVPVELCVLSTGFVQLSPEVSAICNTFPTLFPNQIKASDTEENCGNRNENENENNCFNPCEEICNDRHNSCDPCRPNNRSRSR